MSRGRLHGWRSDQRVSRLGSVDSTQRALAGSLVVPGTTAGAARLGDVYWAEVVRFTRGLVRARVGVAGVELRVLGRGPTLLRVRAASARGVGRDDEMRLPDPERRARAPRRR